MSKTKGGSLRLEKPKKKRGRPKKSEEEKKRPLPKKEKPKKEKPTKPKKEPKEKPTGDRVKEIRALIADLRQDLKDGLISKKFYQQQVEKLTDRLEKGGKI